jgi:signal transduction histidine kinase
MALQLLGIEEDLEGQHLFDHMPRDTFGVLEEQRIGVKNPTWTVRFTSIKENFPLVASVAVVDEKDEQTLGLIILLRDMSAEDELDHLKSKFLENVSNHLRNPLTSLKGFLDLLSEDIYASAPPRQREYLEVMNEETARLAEIVEDLLSLSKIELTDFKVIPENFPISETVLTAMIQNQSAAQAKGLTLKSEIAEGIGQASADKEIAADIINRLVTNAIKYSPPDSNIILGARTCSRPGQKGAREIFVRDFGPGIPDDKREVIFAKYREHRLFSDADTHGIGLGLPICKQLAEINGGTIGVEAAEGGGSVFYFTLPAAKQMRSEGAKDQ